MPDLPRREAEKPRSLAASIEHEAPEVWFCRCPSCVDEFRTRPDELIEKDESMMRSDPRHADLVALRRCGEVG